MSLAPRLVLITHLAAVGRPGSWRVLVEDAPRRSRLDALDARSASTRSAPEPPPSVPAPSIASQTGGPPPRPRRRSSR